MDEQVLKTLSIISTNFLSASEIVDTIKEWGEEKSVVLLKHDLESAIVKAQVTLDALKSFRDSLDK